jgi:transposase
MTPCCRRRGYLSAFIGMVSAIDRKHCPPSIGTAVRLHRNPQPTFTILPLPSKSPELNPVENVWQFMRDNWRIFKSYDDLVDHCCAAWNKLTDQPWRIMSIGLRWAHRF